MKKLNTILQWLKANPKKTAAIAIALLLTVGGSIFVAVNAANTTETPAAAKARPAQKETKAETIIDEIKLNVTSPDEKWTAESSPAIIHIKGTDDNTKSTDFYHAISYGKEEPNISLVSGEYELTVVAPINADGSIHILANANKDADKDGTKETLTFNSADYVTKDDTTDKLLVEITIKQIPADQVTDEMMKEVVDNIKTAIANGDDTLKGDNGKQILETVNKNVDANEHISDETKESTKETTESAQSETESKPTETVKPDNTNNTGDDNNDNGNSSNNNSSDNNKPNPSKPKDPVWVPEQGHYEDIVEQVWVSNWVTVIITPESTKQVYDYSTYVFAYDGYTTTSGADCDAHAVELVLAGNPSNFTEQVHYKTVTTPAVTKQEDQGSYQNKVTGQKWVVDVPGHWE